MSMQKHRGSLVWLIAWLSLGSAVWLASPRSAQNHAKANAPSLSAISGKKLSQDDRLSSSGKRLKSIERVEVGQRVATGISQEIRDLAIGDPLAVPQWDRIDHEIDSQTWRKLTLVMHTPQGDRFDITLLRPIGWLESCNARVGSSIHLVVSEQGLDGLADVHAIEPCPSISSGVGRVVTGTFTHVRGGILRIKLAGLAEPLGVTSNHSIYSADRLDFVRAGELRVGETLRNLDGDVRIESIEQLGTEERVYNLEIHGEHVFRVASSGVLVHNSSGAQGSVNAVDNATAAMGKRLQRLGYDEANATRIMNSITNGEQVVIVGEKMSRVQAVARMVEGAGGEAVTYAPRNFTGLNKNTMEANRSWVRYWSKTKDTPTIDIGRQPTIRPDGPSPFYGMENRSLHRWGVYTPF